MHNMRGCNNLEVLGEVELGYASKVQCMIQSLRDLKDQETKIYDAMKEFIVNTQLVAHIQENLKDSEKHFDNEKIFNSVEEIIINLVSKQERK